MEIQNGTGPVMAKGRRPHKRPEWDDLLVLALVFAPMTGLRIWKIGPGEFFALLWALPFLPTRKLKKSPILRFFAVFLGSMAVGSVIGLVVARDELILSEWSTWLYLMIISLGLYRGLSLNTPERNEQLLLRFSTASAVWNILLFLYSYTGARSIFGAPLWYFYRYSAGGTNPHQIALVVCSLILVFTRELIYRRKMLWNILLIIGLVAILSATYSSTALMATAAGVMVSVVVVINRNAFGSRRHNGAILVELLLGLLVLVVFYQILYQYFYDWVASDSNGLGRFQIFSRIGKTFEKSPLFGLGPGTHSRDENGYLIEYHNTYLEVLAASGLVGVYALLAFTIRLLRKVSVDTTYLPVIVALYTFGLAGFGMRRLFYWGMITFIFVIAEQRKAKEILNP